MPERMRFYDISKKQSLNDSSGYDLPIHQIIEQKRSLNPSVFQDNDLLMMDAQFDFDPLGFKKTSRWERAVKTMIYCISDHIPTREEVKRGRQIVERLPHYAKKKVERKFILTLLPYLLTGFKVHLEGEQDESNHIGNAAYFLNNLLTLNKVSIASLLCSHREADAKKPYSLVNNVPLLQVERALNLEIALVANSPAESGYIDWYQQSATTKASSNMFPEVFLRYMKDIEIAELLILLDSHFKQVETYLRAKTTTEIPVRLHSLDEFTNNLDQELSKLFGENWREAQVHQIPDRYLDELIGLAFGTTLPEIKRLMPFYQESALRLQDAVAQTESNLVNARKLSMSVDFDLEDVSASAISWFIENQKMSPEAKALYETFFYYYWGYVSAANNLLGIGLERDCSVFQTKGWDLGHRSSGHNKKNSTPILYARRNPKEIANTNLANISFRQFWREE